MLRNDAADELLSTADAARILGLSPDMIRLLARAGSLPIAVETVRGVRLFRRKDVEAHAAERAGHREHQHIAQFYEAPEFLCRAIADFLAEGLKSHSPIMIVACEERVQAVLDELARIGQDLAQARSAGRVTVLDAGQTLEEFMVDDMPDRARFRSCMGGLIELSRKAARGHQRLRIYGEMVDLLCRQGRFAAALRFEELWNELAEGQQVSRLCGYSMANFSTGDDSPTFEQLCSLHTRVIPTERYIDQTDPQDRLRKVAMLEQRAHALTSEIALRQSAERELHAIRDSGAQR